MPPTTRSQHNNIAQIDFRNYVSPSSIFAFMMRDPVLDWFKYHGEKSGTSRDKFDPTSFMEWIKHQGHEFEHEMIEVLREKVRPAKIHEVSPQPDSRSTEQYKKTLDLMSQGQPYIYQAVLRSDKHEYYGIADLLVRSDHIRKLYPQARVEHGICRWSPNWCYLVIDLKFKMLPLSADLERVLNSGTIPANKGQLYMYNIMLGEMQDYQPDLAYLLGRGWRARKCGQKLSSQSALNRLGYVDFSHNFDTKYQHMVEEAVAWVRRVRREGKNMDPWDNPTNEAELFPNMKNQFDSPWHNAKAQLAEDIGEITSVYYCGVNKRNNAHTNDVYTWRSPACTSHVLGTAQSRRKVIDQMLRVNRGEISEPFYPEYIQNDTGGWQTPPRGREYFVDFESKNSTDDDFNDLPYVGAEEYIFMIGVAWHTGDAWEYRCFMVDKTEHDQERKIIDDFLQLVGTNNRCYHWSHAEPRMLASAFQRHGIPTIDMPDFVDMLKIFRDEPVSIRGALNYSLKSITRAMYKLNYIDEAYDGECADGMSAVMIVVNAKGTNLHSNPNMKKVTDYNKKDCVILGKILHYLREHRIAPHTITLRSGRVVQPISSASKRIRVVADDSDVETLPPPESEWVTTPEKDPSSSRDDDFETLPPPMFNNVSAIEDPARPHAVSISLSDTDDSDDDNASEKDGSLSGDDDFIVPDDPMAINVMKAFKKILSDDNIFTKSSTVFEPTLAEYKEYLQDHANVFTDEEIEEKYNDIKHRLTSLKQYMKSCIPSPYRVLELDITLDQQREIFQLYNILIESGDYNRETYMAIDEIRRRINYYETVGKIPDYPNLAQRIKVLPIAKAVKHTLLTQLNAVAVDGLSNDGNADSQMLQIAYQVEHHEKICAHPNYTPPVESAVMSLREQIMVADLSEQQKKALYAELDRNDPHGLHGGETWVREVLRVPWGKVKLPPVTADSPQDEITEYLAQVWCDLTETHVGSHELKKSILDIVAKYIRNPNARGIVIAFGGPPGTGKSELAGIIAKALGRGYHKIELGGIADATLIRGSESHWVGSKEGEPIRAMIATESINPVVAIDEVDKIDKSSVFGALIHYCDVDQSDKFRDDYMAKLGSVDVSKHIRILIYNDETRVDNVLLDRALKFKFKPYTGEEKVQIAQRALIPRILEDLQLQGAVKFTDGAVARFIGLSAHHEEGVRQLQRNLQSALQKINKMLLTGELSAPVTVGETISAEAVFWEPGEELSFRALYT